MKFSVTVTLKKDVLDPQGKVVEKTLKNMGYSNIENVRQGKYFEIEVNESNKENAEKIIEMAEHEMKFEIDEMLFRPVEVEELFGDSSKLAKTTGWSPK